MPSVNTKTNPTFKLGRKPNTAANRRVRLNFIPEAATYTPPASVDYYSDVPAANWGMLANDILGDCTCADQGHKEYGRNIKAGNTVSVPTAAEATTLYEKAAGYNPKDPYTDEGAEIQAIENYGFTTGFTFGGTLHKLAIFWEIDYTNTNLVKWCVDQFGAVSLGINFPTSAMDQFNEGKPWDYDTSLNNTIEGGHDIVILGYDTNYYYVITWGAVQKMTPAFYNKFAEEAWSDVSTDFVNALSGDSPLLETLYQLGTQYSSITGKTNPIPAPVVPTPTPTPVPTPTPSPAPTPSPVVVDSVDLTFYNAIKGWSEGKKTLPQNATAAKEIQTWIVGKGLSA